MPAKRLPVNYQANMLLEHPLSSPAGPCRHLMKKKSHKTQLCGEINHKLNWITPSIHSSAKNSGFKYCIFENKNRYVFESPTCSLRCSFCLHKKQCACIIYSADYLSLQWGFCFEDLWIQQLQQV